MKRTLKILIVTLLLAVFTIALASCGDKKTEISLKEDAMPQSVFVLGEEIDLSSGVIVVNKKGKISEIPMNSEGVTVSGYDKNTLGEQKITITYKEKTLELNVNVVERMQLVDHTADYIVGDKLDLTKGRLKITRNDGSNYTVVLKSDKVSISGFNSDTAGEKTITVKYTSASDNYTGTFKLNVHEAESIKLTPPTKVSYKSHDGVAALDSKGGILTLSALDGKIKRDVTVTADMIEGFDPTAANETNSPLSQILTVNYNGEKFTYEVEIIYTSVSKFKDNASLVSDFVWSGVEEPDISDEVGEKALELMELYFDMSPAEQSLLSRTETLNMARTAMIYGFTVWYNDLLEFEGAFGLDEYGDFSIQCESADAVAAAIEKLKDTDRPIYSLYNVINSMVETFVDSEGNSEVLFTFTETEDQMGGEALFADYAVIDSEIYPELKGIFEYMLVLNGYMEKVGADWKTVGVETYADEIRDVFNCIVNSDYYHYDYTQFFFFVSRWREGDDAFNYLYEYYYNVMEDTAAIMQLSNVRLPSELEIIFAHVSAAMEEIDGMANYMVTDSSRFFYHYHKIATLTDELAAMDHENNTYVKMLKELYLALPLNGMLGISADSGLVTISNMIEYLTTTQGGYYALCGALLGVEEFDNLMDQYIKIIVSMFETEDYDNSDAYINDVKEMLALYMQLTPAQQFTFLGTLNTYYAMNIPPISFDTDSEYAEFISIFNDMLVDVYTAMFEGQDAKDAYVSLMIATELYAQRYTNANWLNDFKSNMKKIETALGSMSDADKAVFNANLSYIYNEYKDILGKFNDTEGGDSTEPSAPDLGEWADEIEALKEAVTYIEIGYYAIDSGHLIYNIFFSAFERAQSIYNYILANGDDNIKYILVHEDIYPANTLGNDPDENTMYWSYDYVLSVYRSIYTNALLALDDGQSVYYIYQEQLASFMEKSYDLYWSGDKSKVFDIMREFRSLDVEAQIFFLTYFNLDEEFYYYAAIESAFEDIKYSENVRNAAIELLNLEMVAIVYDFYYSLYEDGDVTEEELADITEELNAAYQSFMDIYAGTEDSEGLSEKEMAEFNADFADMYEYYKNVVEAANGSVNA